MDRYYYQYTVQVDKFKDEIESFLMDRFYNGIEESDGKLILRSEKPLDDIMDELRAYVDSLIELFDTDIHLEITKEKKENINWIEKYKKSITPVEVGEFYIYPSWYEPKEGKVNIKIDPALAFGSGHHETTRGCLSAIQKYVQPGMELLDVGCGSGILSIAAAKKGAVVDICDTDTLALEESQKNFSLNKVEFQNGWVGSAANAKKKYDIVIANIVADVLTMIAFDLQKATKEGGILILSGIIEKYRNKVQNRFDFSILEEVQEGEWITMILRNDRGTDGK
ncbi:MULTISPECIES: 50S ribosomal protein L11 methyltransferase [unclassified Nitratiruptor]|uniref:50S ribosomal protein L11 methyltransferase n=1 Tax=unclassified Nitratiruptor TaxID=2624044 RepID=UPI001915FAD4|nr:MULTISPECIES: 50S ribosomal protein L11 methyltransferase [unclassified Nitratiruptor]BCD60717.1 ribosomal protein L11 methyltransferase [Nitratiruptor sp. YY08-10]BCD64649.1 ribosomal protein L11 methyltransferase [Nitratiruptor sp. YY08-14]